MEAGEDDKAWTAEDETVEKEAVTLFISMMQTVGKSTQLHGNDGNVRLFHDDVAASS